MRFSSTLIFSILSTILLFSTPAVSKNGSGKVILASHDYTEVLAQALTEGTSIKVIRAIPKNYSPDVHQNYLKKHWQKFSDLAEKADSAVFVSAFWPDDPLYPYARRANIRIVPLDLAKPLDNSRAGIPVTELPDSSKKLHYLWNSPGNCARMSDILASDLVKLYPGEKKVITDNLDTLKRALFSIRTNYEVAFGELEAFEAVTFTTDFIYLTDEFGINMIHFFLKPEHKWTEKDLDDFQQLIIENGIQCVIGKWQPNNNIFQAINSSSAKFVTLQSFKKKTDISAFKQLTSFYEENLKLLLVALQ